ncbi:hypothetical protein MASR1M29_23240 [Cloacibacterium normanense]
MKKFELLKNKGKVISKEKMKTINGGYSWLWCLTHSVDIKINDTIIYDAPVGGEADEMTWDECRAKKD